MQIASQHAKAISERSRIGMEERLFFDRIALRASNVSPRNVKLAAAVETDLADPGLSLGNRTTMPAGKTTQAIVLQCFDQPRVSLTNVAVENGPQGGHSYL